MKPFKDTYVMYQLLEFISENSIITLCKVSKKLNEICKQYIELEDDKRFEVLVNNDKWDNSNLLNNYCMDNDVIKIRKVIETDSDLDWSLVFYEACTNDNIDIAKLMIEKGANNLNWGLCISSRNGNMDIAKLVIEKGAYAFNAGLERACQFGHMDIVKILFEKGANWCYHCHKSMEEHMKKFE